ncbi:DUF302 domain-containing protein [Hyphomicrobium sp. 99]|uniref:DUF302 domain-containing protein n=1 Tax=Hyphomicrobium sp. 99 TaxID=1163419 RepID=UPI0005F78837|nr:DUF302 domain-containing protein [Hyphomicrobium sp. 99]
MVEGLITLRSHHPAKETADRLAALVANHNATLVARIDHAAAAAKVGLDLRPTEVLIFGNPNVGTLLMQQAQVIGLDLPTKVLVWQDDNGVTWLSYQDIGWLVSRYGIASAVRPTVDKLSSLLRLLTEEAAGQGN